MVEEHGQGRKGVWYLNLNLNLGLLPGDTAMKTVQAKDINSMFAMYLKAPRTPGCPHDLCKR